VLFQSTSTDANDLILNSSELTKTKPATYRWLKNAGIAEISFISGRFFRVFFSSHILLVAWIFVFIAGIFQTTFSKKERRLSFFYGCIYGAALFISFSRSLWLGFFAGLLLLFLFLLKKPSIKKQVLITTLVLIGIILVSFIFTNIGGLLSTRVNGLLHPSKEVATTHRVELAKAIWNQWQKNPIIGSGFGTTVSFPTVLPSGEVINVAFYIYEWGYFDIAVKIGILGLGAIVLLLIRLYSDLFSLKKALNENFPLAIIAGLTALAVANISTPVFTHPLGIIAIALFCIFAYNTYENPNSNRNLEQ
jgi:O-antigen ligase